MHMLSKKDWSSNKMETLLRSRNTTTVVTANGEVQTIEEIQVYVHDLELLVTVQVLEDTPAVLSLGKLCEEHGDTYKLRQRLKATPNQTREEDSLQDGKFSTSCCPWIVVQIWYQSVLYIATAGLINCIVKSSNRAKSR